MEKANQMSLLNLQALAAYLDELGIGKGEIDASPIGDGHSNITFTIRRDGTEFVLRRPPLPPYAESAHDMVREAKLIDAIAGDARVPKVIAICESSETLGVPFYLMEFVDGLVIGPSFPEGVWSPEARPEFGEKLVEALVEIHSIPDPASILGPRFRSDGYLERQLNVFEGLWNRDRTREVPGIDQAARWLRLNIPTSRETTIVHGDFRLGNAIFSRNERPELVAVLDWEMATAGDPLADVGYMIAMWAEPGDPETPMSVLSTATTLPGFSSRADLQEQYVRTTGRDLTGIGWYEILALWKSSVFLECSYRRFAAGRSFDSYFATLDEGVPALGALLEERLARIGRHQ